MTIEIVARFPVDDAELSALHARAFGNDPARVEPWARHLVLAGAAAWLLAVLPAWITGRFPRMEHHKSRLQLTLPLGLSLLYYGAARAALGRLRAQPRFQLVALSAVVVTLV